MIGAFLGIAIAVAVVVFSCKLLLRRASRPVIRINVNITGPEYHQPAAAADDIPPATNSFEDEFDAIVRDYDRH
jgi:hypothetical protein